jgi:hypothetical protein
MFQSPFLRVLKAFKPNSVRLNPIALAFFQFGDYFNKFQREQRRHLELPQNKPISAKGG